MVTFHAPDPTALLWRPTDDQPASLLGAEAGEPQIEQQPGRPRDAGLVPEHAVYIAQLGHQRHGPELLGGDDLRRADGATGYSELLRHGETGRGLNDYDAIFRILSGVGFSGWISVEDGMNGLDELRRSVAFLKKKRQQYYV